jgi:hypothetical protein
MDRKTIEPPTTQPSIRESSTAGAGNKRPRKRYTPTIVIERLEDAANVLRRLPPVKVQGYFSVWPTIKPEFSDLVGRMPAPMKRPPPSAKAISNMEEALDWTIGLDPLDAKTVWLRAGRKRWKEICRTVGLEREAAQNHWLYAIYTITWRLNGKVISKNLSRTQVMAAIKVERSQEKQ